jgi:hypothetical protein
MALRSFYYIIILALLYTTEPQNIEYFSMLSHIVHILVFKNFNSCFRRGVPVLLKSITINKTVNGVLYLHSHFLCKLPVERGRKRTWSETSII